VIGRRDHTGREMYVIVALPNATRMLPSLWSFFDRRLVAPGQLRASWLARLALITPSWLARADWPGGDRAPLVLGIDERAEDAKRVDRNSRMIGVLERCAGDRIQHPLQLREQLLASGRIPSAGMAQYGIAPCARCA
jgi:hypothetical protein